MTNQQTSWSRDFQQKLIVPQLVKKFLAYCRTRRFITVIKRARHLSLSWSGQYIPRPLPVSWISVVTLSTNLHLGRPSGLLPIGFPTKTHFASLVTPVRANYPARLIFRDYLDESTSLIVLGVSAARRFWLRFHFHLKKYLR